MRMSQRHLVSPSLYPSWVTGPGKSKTAADEQGNRRFDSFQLIFFYFFFGGGGRGVLQIRASAFHYSSIFIECYYY